MKDRANWKRPTLRRILPGETRRLRLRWDPYQELGKKSIVIRVDHSDHIQESREDNNEATAELYFRKKIDLTFASKDFNLLSQSPDEGYSFRAGVRNVGETDSDVFEILIHAYHTEEATEPFQEFLIPEAPAIRAGRARGFPLTLPPRTMRFELHADLNEDLEEETHTNNGITLKVSDFLKPGK